MLTKNQKIQLEQLQNHKTLFVGYSCPPLMRTFEKLVELGYARVSKKYQIGKDFEIIEVQK